MTETKKKSHLLKRIILHSAKWPIAYLLVGVFLVGLSHINAVFPLTEWTNLLLITDELGAIVIAFAFLVFAYNLFIFLCFYYEKKFNENNKVAPLVLGSIRKGSRIIFFLALINIILSITVPTQRYDSFANHLINTILIGSIGWMAIQLLYMIEVMLHQHMKAKAHMEAIRAKTLYTKMRIFRNFGTVIIIVITIAAILMSFSSVRSFGISLLASAGFLTAIVGLSAQKTLVSLFSGLQIAIAQPIKIGDVIVIEKETGIVEEITFTYVTLKIGDNRKLIVPVSYFIEKSFENWSHESAGLRCSLNLYVDYLMPIQPIREKLTDIVESSPYWDKLAHKLQVANLNDRSVELRIQISAANADDLSDLRAEVREKLLEFIRDSYPSHLPKVRFNNDGDSLEK